MTNVRNVYEFNHVTTTRGSRANVADSGSFFYNYKHTHSIALMAVAGLDYECIYANVVEELLMVESGTSVACRNQLMMELPSPT